MLVVGQGDIDGAACSNTVPETGITVHCCPQVFYCLPLCRYSISETLNSFVDGASNAENQSDAWVGNSPMEFSL